jgi:dihydrofolate synthase/folylpolyglutamate synthase
MTPDRQLAALAKAHGIRPGLERMTALLARLGNPERGLRVVHVAGTNGKGSVCALVAEVLRAAGHRVLRYTSPHLVFYRERYWLDGRWIAPGRFEAALAHIDRTVRELEARLGVVTEFERLTAIAFWLAREEAVDWLVLEVGLGGRLDATNVVMRPEVSVITRIARDHVEWLGEALTDIAREKAGILRPAVPLVTGASGEALEAIRDVAGRTGTPCRVVEADGAIALSWQGEPVEVALPGAYQRVNAAIALQVLDVLHERGHALSGEAVRTGFARVRWPGRLEPIQVPDGPLYWLDGAHNEDGARALAASLPRRPGVLVFGALADKEPERLARILAPLAPHHVLVPVASPRTWTPVAEGVWAGARVVADVAEALRVAEEAAAGAPILVAGSLYLVGAVRHLLGVQDPEA